MYKSFKAWWDISWSLYCKYNAVCICERILKIGLYLTKLWSWWPTFYGPPGIYVSRGYDCAIKQLAINLTAAFLTDKYVLRCSSPDSSVPNAVVVASGPTIRGICFIWRIWQKYRYIDVFYTDISEVGLMTSLPTRSDRLLVQILPKADTWPDWFSYKRLAHR